MKYTSRGKGNCFDGGDLIREHLKKRYMTQRDLATAINMHPAKLSEILNGIRRPSKKELGDIKDNLGIDLNEWREQYCSCKEWTLCYCYRIHRRS